MMHQAGFVGRLQATATHSTGGVVLPFSRMALRDQTPPSHRFSARDRICAMQWIDCARALGVTRLTIEPATESDNGETVEFLLIYANGDAWASWGVACGPTGMILWHSARGTTIGVFPTLVAALAEIERRTNLAKAS